MQDKPEEFNYKCTEHCDTCGNEQEGTMHHCNDAMGMATPVLWQCSRCVNPPFFVNVYRETKRRLLRTKLLFKKYVLTSRADRKAREAKVAEIRARHAARREAAK